MIYNIVDDLLRQFKINVNQIISNSDNTLEDLRNEAVLIVQDKLSSIQKDKRVFINELKKRCLKFNKYSKRIESKERWEIFNNYETRLIETVTNPYNTDENLVSLKADITDIVGEENYNLLIDYFTLKIKDVAVKYGISETELEDKIMKLLIKIRRAYGRE